MNNLVFIQISYHIFQLTSISLSSLHTHFSNCSHLPLLVQVPHCHCHCYSPTHWDYISMDLANFSLFFILSDHFRLQIVRKFPMETHLSHALYHSTNTCLPHGEPCFIKPNFILDSSFLCCAWLCCSLGVSSSEVNSFNSFPH